ncbi:amino acid ABC transporter ATP-binding protein [Jiangella asiatica]|uniref:Amino acid ABC transporter ATP-binding protein n=1 Tax=Jiangella asiatica TaxID=2530372 RepID=A0A4R5D755_9ACTN|nr:amino acid ABC transporter ATP-binding protein [Jiangella asiatica]TDE08457.1 amino acid ABC transporter ATP-binding protein [Jiangella asiatica]
MTRRGVSLPDPAASARDRATRTAELAVQVDGLCKSFGTNVVLDGVDLHVTEGQVVSILGRSGSGKSTLLRCINLLEIPDGGRVQVGRHRAFDNGHALRGNDLVKLRQAVGMVFQSFHLFPHLTAIENVALPLMQLRGRDVSKAIAESLELLDRVGLAEKSKQAPHQLSGGQQQRVAIARALAVNPKVLLFDEPTSALDPESTVDVLNVMRNISSDGMTMIVVTHELSFATEVSNRIVMIDEGKVIEDGSPTSVSRSTNPRTASFFKFFDRGPRLRRDDDQP